MMPREKKTAENETESTKSTSKTKLPKGKTKSDENSKIVLLEKRLHEVETKLHTLVTVIHGDFRRGNLQGPEGLASKLRKAQLLS
tara:strand:+ start:178 stop:432 length:255 start_codon:yes stop_codon:yes gene_type:complete